MDNVSSLQDMARQSGLLRKMVHKQKRVVEKCQEQLTCRHRELRQQGLSYRQAKKDPEIIRLSDAFSVASMEYKELQKQRNKIFNEMMRVEMERRCNGDTSKVYGTRNE